METLPEWVATLGGRAFQDTLATLHHHVRRRIEYVRDAPGQLRPDGRPGAGASSPRDHWQSPRETLARGAGDSEDCAILCYAVLRMAGAGADDVALRYCRTLHGPHMVCQARADAASPWYALDLLHPDPLPADDLERHYGYLLGYSLSESGLTLDGELRGDIVREWSRVLGELAAQDARFTAELPG